MKKRLIGTVCAAAMLLAACGNEGGGAAPTSAAAPTEAESSGEEEVSGDIEGFTPEDEYDTVEEVEITAPEGYHLVWNDEFSGSALSPDDWNYEVHEVGWVNHELQEYVASEEYAYVKDGNLVIQPVKKEEGGNVSYYSGRVNTQNHHDYKYGWFEARLKVPKGKGFLPAFWMMPQDEDYYGQWPKCGEIDIMEVLGDEVKRNYGTLHFGEPHTQRQGTFDMANGNYADDFHTFAVEWEPGVIRWYVDGEKYFETSDWFSALGDEERPYPAPFNQPFHVILNVAVGGDWPGDPAPDTAFDENAQMVVDYVRIFQKDSYDENVERPVEQLDFREADETGNFVYNGDFGEVEDLTDEENWKFLIAKGGEGAAEIGDHEIIITSSNEGTEEYAVQLVQPCMPMEQGSKYVFTFEAYAEEPRTIKPAITAPDVNWIRYLEDTPVDLTTEWQSFSFSIDMTKKSDDNGRVEFNMGKQGSTATVHIRNVRLEKVE
ncbi:MAG: family 16 glycosylhydrolase [Lachnospiraceae bacterium]|nr:family 16 glycosylhydrolase [Lachnospiraceae bacterium]